MKSLHIFSWTFWRLFICIDFKIKKKFSYLRDRETGEKENKRQGERGRKRIRESANKLASVSSSSPKCCLAGVGPGAGAGIQVHSSTQQTLPCSLELSLLPTSVSIGGSLCWNPGTLIQDAGALNARCSVLGVLSICTSLYRDIYIYLFISLSIYI